MTVINELNSIPKAEKFLSELLPKLNVVGYHISDTGVFYYNIDDEPFSDELLSNGTLCKHSIFCPVRGDDPFLIGNNIQIGEFISKLLSYNNLPVAVFPIVSISTAMASTFKRIRQQIISITKKMRDCKRQAQAKAAKFELKRTFKTITNKYKRLPRDEVFDIMEQALNELKVEDVMKD
jgi:hypothetical protein